MYNFVLSFPKERHLTIEDWIYVIQQLRNTSLMRKFAILCYPNDEYGSFIYFQNLTLLETWKVKRLQKKLVKHLKTSTNLSYIGRESLHIALFEPLEFIENICGTTTYPFSERCNDAVSDSLWMSHTKDQGRVAALLFKIRFPEARIYCFEKGLQKQFLAFYKGAWYNCVFGGCRYDYLLENGWFPSLDIEPIPTESELLRHEDTGIQDLINLSRV